ncbi:dihydroxy-acid dehydratase [Streptomyces parvulus]|uniref:dihydroxy-acid dehydratase domain-containing protein n=1 Tax=Streptomyces parvulus TaxID=146923 RepID=UPI0036F9C774
MAALRTSGCLVRLFAGTGFWPSSGRDPVMADNVHAVIADFVPSTVTERKHPAPRSAADPVFTAGGRATLQGGPAPVGAVLKRSAADPRLRRHRGPAVVFDGVADLNARIDGPAHSIAKNSVLVLRGAGPVSNQRCQRRGIPRSPRRCQGRRRPHSRCLGRLPGPRRRRRRAQPPHARGRGPCPTAWLRRPRSTPTP